LRVDLTADELAQFGIREKVAIVTGGAAGIGAAVAKLFSRVGASVVIADLDEARARAVAEEVCAEGGSAIAVRSDVSNEEDWKALVERTVTQFGGLDVLVNNAVYRRKADFMTMPMEEWEIMHAVIARGTFMGVREAVKRMIEQGRGGSIVNISSVSALHPTILNNVHYDSAKAGVEALTRATAYEFAKHNIRINGIRPGATNTAGPASARAAQNLPVGGPLTQGGIGSWARIPLGRPAEAIDQARAILFLASPASAYITGQFISVDGGFLIG